MKLAVLVYLRQDLQPLQAFLAWSQPVRPVSHTFSYYAQYSAH